MIKDVGLDLKVKYDEHVVNIAETLLFIKYADFEKLKNYPDYKNCSRELLITDLFAKYCNVLTKGVAIDVFKPIYEVLQSIKAKYDNQLKSNKIIKGISKVYDQVIIMEIYYYL